MLTLIATLLGGVSSLLPGILGYFQKKQELAHDIELAKLDMDKMRLANELQINMANVNADIGEANSVHANDAGLDGGKFVNALRASVRPTLTYAFFLLFLAIKLSALYILMKAGVSFVASLPLLWDSDTNAIFGAIMGFWFGSRSLDRFGFGKKK